MNPNAFAAFNFYGAGNTVVSGTIVGGAALTKSGTGTLTLSNANTYSGGTTINIGGNLAITNGSALGTGNVTVAGTSTTTGTLQISNNIAAAGVTTFSLTGLAVNPLSGAQAGSIAQIENVSGANSLSANIGISTSLGANANILSDAGTLTLSGTLNAQGAIFNFYGAGNTVVSGAIGGTTAIAKEGTGTLTLKGANTSTGNATIEAGTLLLDNNAGGSLSPNSTVFDGGGVFQYNGVAAGTSAQTLGSLTLLPGQSSIVLSGGTGTTLNLGTLTRSSGGTADFVLPTGDTVTTTTAGTGPNGILGYATVGGTTFAATVVGTGGYNLSGLATSGYSSTLTTPLAQASGLDVDVRAAGSNGTLAGSPVTLDALRFNDGTGTSTVDATDGITLASGGILETAAVGANAVSIVNGTITGNTANGSDLVVTQNDTLAAMTIGSQITGASGLTKAGAGVLTLTGANSYTGQTTVAQGTLQMGAANVLPATALLLGGSITGANLDLNGFNQTVGSLNTNSVNGGTFNPNASITNSGAALATLTVNGTGTYGGTIKDGAGKTALTVAGGTQTLTGVNTYSGATTVTGGTLTAGANNALSPNSAVVLADTTLAIGTYNEKIGSLAGSSASGNVTIGTGLLSIGSDNTSTTYAGNFSLSGTAGATGGFSKVGTGTLTLTGGSIALPITHIYVNNGTLQLGTGSNISGILKSASSISIGQNTGDTAAASLFYTSALTAGTDLNVGEATGANGTLSVNSSNLVSTPDTVTATHLYVGKSGTATGVINQAGGTGSSSFYGSLVQTGSTGDAIVIGGASASDAAAVGVYNLTGGTLQTTISGAATTIGNLQVGGYGSGQLNQSGGTVTVTGTAEAGQRTGSFGVIDVAGNSAIGQTATFTQQVGAGTNKLIIGDGGTGILNARLLNTNNGGSGTYDKVTAAGSIIIGNSATGVGIVNLDAGTLAATSITTANGGTGTLNFNGGTLKSLASGGTLLGGVTNAYVYGSNRNNFSQTVFYGGGTIDTTGGSTTISQNLLAPTGSGVGYITLGSVGSGFKTAPLVKITGGGGTGATAVATFNSGNGTLTGITMTNTGVNYTSAPTITLVTANGGTGAAFTSALVANTLGGFTKIGANTLTLSGNNTFGSNSSFGSSPTFLGFNAEQGTIIAATDTALGVGPLLFYTFSNTATVVDFTSLTPSVGSIATYQSSYGQYSSIVLGNAGTTPNATSLTFGSGNFSTSYAGTISDGTATNAAAIGSLVKVGTATQTFSGVNTYTGGTTISGGVLQVAADASLGASAGIVTINAATLDVTGSGATSTRAVVLGSAVSTIQADGTYTVTGTVSDGTSVGKLNKTGSGSLVLTGANTYSGGTSVSGGILSGNAAGPVSTGSFGTGSIAVNSGTLDLEGVTGGGTVGTVANSISGAGNVAQGAAGTVSAGTILTLTGTNSYTGGTTVGTGTLSGNVNSFGTGNITTNSPGTVDYTQGTAGTVNNNITGTGQVTVNGNASSLNGSGGQITYAGVDSASGSTTVTGARLELSHANGGAVTGPVTAGAGGTVGLSSDNQIATSSNVTLLANGTLASEGHNEGTGIHDGVTPPTPGMGTLQIGSPTLAATATIDFGDTTIGGVQTPAPNTLAFADSSGLAWNGTLNIANYTRAADQLYIGTSNVPGNGGLTPQQLAAIKFNGVSGATQLGNGEVVAAAPELSGWASMIIGLSVLGGVIARRRQTA